MQPAILAARSGRFIEGLINKDPVAWSILGGIVAIGLISTWYKKRKGDS